MRLRWRGLELPSRIIRDDSVSTDSYGRFTIEPFEQGFGTTIGNSLRRILLSSLEGAAITTVKIAGVSHEFATIEGVLEDVTDILLNVKGIVLRLEVDVPSRLSVQRDTAGEVRAGDITCDQNVTIFNRDHLIATLTADVPFHVEMMVGKGRGYATGSENRSPEQEIGVIPVDSVYSPVVRVRYRTENMRVGQRTNFDRLIMDLWTDGTVSPQDALVEAGLILRKYTNPFVMYQELGGEIVTKPFEKISGVASTEDTALSELLARPIASLNLSVRAVNCLDAARIASLRDIVQRTEGELLRFRSFGKTSLHEVQRKLSEIGLSLAMAVDEPESVTGGESPEGDSEEDVSPSPLTPNVGPMEAFTMGE